MKKNFFGIQKFLGCLLVIVAALVFLSPNLADAASKVLTINLNDNIDGQVQVEWTWKNGTHYQSQIITESTDLTVGKFALVTLTAIEGSQSNFDDWSGYQSGSNLALPEFSMDGDNRTINANFIEPVTVRRSLNLSFDGDGDGIVHLRSSSLSTSISADDSVHSYDFDEDEIVELSIELVSPYLFYGWDDDLSGTATTETLTMSENKDVTALFVGKTLRKLTLAVGGTGSGTVTLTGSSGGDHVISNSTGGLYDFYYDEVVTLSASVTDGTFDGWGGDLSGVVTPITLVMNDQDHSVIATFNDGAPPGEVSFYVTFSGEGSGSVVLDGSLGNYCTLSSEGTCVFLEGETVSLRANADIGSEFDQWTGDVSSEDVLVSHVASEDSAIEAVFAVTVNGTIPGCGTNTFSDYSDGFEADDFTLNNVNTTGDGYLQLQTGDDAIDPNNIIIPFEQEIAVTFIYEGAGFKLSDFGWLLAEDGIGGTKNEIYWNVNDNNSDFNSGNGVLDVSDTSTADRYGDVNGDGTVDVLDNRISLGTFAAGTELVFYLNVDNESRTYYTKTAWNPDDFTGTTTTKTFYLGKNREDGDDGWLNEVARERAATSFDLNFDYNVAGAPDDTSVVVMTNGQRLPHVIVGAPDDKPNEWLLGWEDLYGGGDKDYNDLVFQIERRTGGVAQLETSEAIIPVEAGAYYTAVSFEVYDNIPCPGQTEIIYYVSIDNGNIGTWVEVLEWDSVHEYTLTFDGTKVVGDEVDYWQAGTPQRTYRTRRIDFSEMGLTGRELIWKGVMSSDNESCVPEILDVSLAGTVATQGDISRASPSVKTNVMYSGSYETPAVDWTSKSLRGHLRAIRRYDPLTPTVTDVVELWDAGAVLTAREPSTRSIFYPEISITTVVNQASVDDEGDAIIGDGVTEEFSGTFSSFPIVAESVVFTVGTETFTDVHTDQLVGSFGGVGEINRFTGEWVITPKEILGVNIPMTVSYASYSSSETLEAFTGANITNTQLSLDDTFIHPDGYRHDFNGDDSFTEADGDWLVNWVRGYENGVNVRKEWVLDAIDHSVPALVTAPGTPSWYSGSAVDDTERASYDAFKDAHEDRQSILLVGSRSGMLHGFDAGSFRQDNKGDNDQTADIIELRGYFKWQESNSWWSSLLADYPDSDPETDAPFFTWQTQGDDAPDYGDGSEMWAFIPANLLPRLKNNLLNGEDRAFVDASPAVSDVYIDGEWKTVVISAEGNGGDTVFCLDITDVNNPTFMWEFADPDLFRSRSSPSVAVLGRIVVGDQKKWAAFFVSGQTRDETLFPSVYVIDIEDGSVIKRITLDSEIDGVGGAPSGQPAAVDSDGNGYIDRIYIGTDKGFMYKVNIPDDPTEVAYGITHSIINIDYEYTVIDENGTPEDDSDDTEQTYEVPESQRFHSIYASPSVVVENTLDSAGQLEYNIHIFFGTGDSPYADEDIDTGNTNYHFFAYTDHAVKGETGSDNVDLNWFYALPAGHRIFASAFASAGNIYFGSATSETENPCSGPNEGRIFAFSYSGVSMLNDGDGDPGVEVGDVITTPLVTDGHLYVRTPSGTVVMGSGIYNTAVKMGGLPYTRLRYWREIF